MRQRFVSTLPKYLCLSAMVVALGGCAGGSSSGADSGSGTDSGVEPDGDVPGFNLKFPYGQLNRIRYTTETESETVAFDYAPLGGVPSFVSHHIVPGQDSDIEDKAYVEELVKAAPEQISLLSYKFEHSNSFALPIKIIFRDGGVPFYKNGQYLNESLEFENVLVGLNSGGVTSDSLLVKEFMKHLENTDGTGVSKEDIENYPVRASGTSTVIDVGTWEEDKFSPKREYVTVKASVLIDLALYYRLTQDVFEAHSGIFENLAAKVKQVPENFTLDITMKLVDGVGAVERTYSMHSSIDKNRDGQDDVLYEASYRNYDYSLIDTDGDHWVDEADRFKYDRFQH